MYNRLLLKINATHNLQCTKLVIQMYNVSNVSRARTSAFTRLWNIYLHSCQGRTRGRGRKKSKTTLCAIFRPVNWRAANSMRARIRSVMIISKSMVASRAIGRALIWRFFPKKSCLSLLEICKPRYDLKIIHGYREI